MYYYHTSKKTHASYRKIQKKSHFGTIAHIHLGKLLVFGTTEKTARDIFKDFFNHCVFLSFAWWTGWCDAGVLTKERKSMAAAVGVSPMTKGPKLQGTQSGKEVLVFLDKQDLFMFQAKRLSFLTIDWRGHNRLHCLSLALEEST